MSPRSSIFLACLALVAACFMRADAHGGTLHPWVLGDADHNFLRYPLATCTAASFKVIPSAAGAKFVPGALPVFNTFTTTQLSLSGSIIVYLYLASNCSNGVTTSLSVNLGAKIMATGNSMPYANSTMYTYGMSTLCANTSAMDLYRNNDTLGDNRFNLMWVNAGVSDATGLFLGSAVNAFRAFGPKEKAKTPKNRLLSLLFMPDPAVGPMMCCDLAWNQRPQSKFFSQGKKCASVSDR